MFEDSVFAYASNICVESLVSLCAANPRNFCLSITQRYCDNYSRIPTSDHSPLRWGQSPTPGALLKCKHIIASFVVAAEAHKDMIRE